MTEPRQVIGVTELPDDLPEGTTVVQKTPCGCYLIFYPGDPGVSEFTCEHGYFVAVTNHDPADNVRSPTYQRTQLTKEQTQNGNQLHGPSGRRHRALHGLRHDVARRV